MRADRLVATLLLLQARGRVTAADVARQLEVSVATARRDLEALSSAGVPVYAQPGRGGGWSLVGGARTDLTGLTAGEARALFLLAGPAATVSAEARSALRKLVRALPETFRATAQAAADAVVVDSAGWGDQDRARPQLVDLLQEAVVACRRVQFGYTSRTGDRQPRLVDPLGLVDKDDVWYLVAGTESGQRTFRVDQMADVVLTQEQAARPVDFELGPTWRRVVDEVEQHRSMVSAVVLLQRRHTPILRDHFGRHYTYLEDRPGGRIAARVAAQDARALAEQLAGWGAMVEVLEPAPVRVELARIGAELVRRYAAEDRSTWPSETLKEPHA